MSSPLDKALPDRSPHSAKRKRIEEKLKPKPSRSKKAKVDANPTVHEAKAAPAVDAVRTKVRDLFANVFFKSGCSRETASPVVKELEEQLFAVCPDPTVYRTRSRELLSDLSNNPALVHQLESGQLSVSDLLQMSSEELANQATKQEREAIKKTNLQEAIAAGPALAETHGEYTCPNCGSKETRAGVLSQRRQIGKSEIWGNSDAPSSVLQVLCDSCRHSWTVSD